MAGDIPAVHQATDDIVSYPQYPKFRLDVTPVQAAVSLPWSWPAGSRIEV